ncbi:hypothetical protein PCASD_21924 [Puccinia coronata f. sp. avenae]|uniref:Uncharacterized protein n=1 Tax=Puccinia coronata f. sp. avenae TaxID=200324 RepID=A0A2N5S6X1_9BASI|nr:hypothetical protein PCASD_21924 [Puccinia coronata f. sp. avenae]
MRLMSRRQLRPHRQRKIVVKTDRACSLPMGILFLAAAFVFFANLTNCQRSGGQFFTPGLLIVNGPAPDSKKPAGKKMGISLEITGDGILTPSNTDTGTQLATAILSVEIYLANKDRNITISQGPELMQGERGSSVKHMDFIIPECTPPGDYQVIFHELDRINGKQFYSIYALPFHVLNAEDTDAAKGAGEQKCTFPASQAELKDSRPSEQPFTKKGQTGFKLQKGKMPLNEGEEIFVPEVTVTTLTIEGTTAPKPPPPAQNSLPDVELVEESTPPAQTPATPPPAEKPPPLAEKPPPPVEKLPPPAEKPPPPPVEKPPPPAEKPLPLPEKPVEKPPPPQSSPPPPPAQAPNRATEASRTNAKEAGKLGVDNTLISVRKDSQQNQEQRSGSGLEDTDFIRLEEDLTDPLLGSSGFSADSPALSKKIAAVSQKTKLSIKLPTITELPKALPPPPKPNDLDLIPDHNNSTSLSSTGGKPSISVPNLNLGSNKQSPKVEEPKRDTPKGSGPPPLREAFNPIEEDSPSTGPESPYQQIVAVEAVVNHGIVEKLAQGNTVVLGQTTTQQFFSVPIIMPSTSASNFFSVNHWKFSIFIYLSLKICFELYY